MMQSLDELAANSSRLLDGEAIVTLDPHLIDASPVNDRTQIDDQDYRDLLSAIRNDGQSTPILVRPHPVAAGRYMIVFGRRRLKAAVDLQIPVRAVVKTLDDASAVVAQGQENSARADLSFIERALFARKIVDAGFPKEIAKAALTVDDTLLSRMLSITDIVPAEAVAALAPAKGVGRDRWEELKKLVLAPKQRDLAIQCVQAPDFGRLDGEHRFNVLLKQLKVRPPRAAKARVPGWASPDQEVAVQVGRKGQAVNIVVSAKRGKPEFGIWLSENLDEVYQTFQKSRRPNQGE